MVMLDSICTVSKSEIERIINFEEADPRSILGPHLVGVDGGTFLSIREYLPRAVKAYALLYTGARVEMVRVDERGFWEGHVRNISSIPKYKIYQQDSTGYSRASEDPYAFEPLLTDYDLHLFAEGTNIRIYEKMGAHLRTVDGVSGVNFTVWAPNARSVAVVANFNHWYTGENPMITRGSSGVWELFVPGVSESEVYKYAIKTSEGTVKLKTDPFAFGTELRPRTAAIVTNLDSYEWGDRRWLLAKKSNDSLNKAMSVYEVHLGSWKRQTDGTLLSYEDIANQLVSYVKQRGFTHVELMPVMEHPLDDSWGYQVVNYFAPTSRYGKPTHFMYLVDKCHQEGIGVILDWVPAHFPKDDYGLASFDGTHLYEHADPRLGEHPDWGTLIFNYSRNEVKEFLIANALFWLDKYHIDGLRLDAVASMLYLDYSRKAGQWLPNRHGGRENLDAIHFLRDLSRNIHAAYPGTLMIAEESTAWDGVTRDIDYGGLGFDLKWNMGWMHDILEYFSKDPIFRKYHQRDLTFGLLYAFSERFILVFSHDEVVYGKRSLLNKMPGDEWQKFANLRLLFGYMFGSPGKKLIFMGSEFGQYDEWNFRTSLDWANSQGERNHKMSLFLSDLNAIYSSRNSLHELDFSYQGFEWIDFKDSEQSIISFVRKSKTPNEFLVFVFNMTPVPRLNYRIGVPQKGYYREILNSDALEYGGSGMGNIGGVHSDDIQWHGRPFSLNLTLPPLAVEVFEYISNG